MCWLNTEFCGTKIDKFWRFAYNVFQFKWWTGSNDALRDSSIKCPEHIIELNLSVILSWHVENSISKSPGKESDTQKRNAALSSTCLKIYPKLVNANM